MNRSVTTFTTDQLNTLRAAYLTLNTAPPDCLPNFHALFDACSDKALRQLMTADIRFVSVLARNAMMRREGSLMAFGNDQIARLMNEGRVRS